MSAGRCSFASLAEHVAAECPVCSPNTWMHCPHGYPTISNCPICTGVDS